MAIIPSKHIPVKGADFDIDNLRLPAEKARYIKNLVDLNSDGIYTPMEGSILQNGAMLKPSGDSIPIGCLESEQTNELYVACWNSQQNHFIYRIRGIDGVSEMVYQSPYLNFQLDPKHFMGHVGRMELISEPYVDRVTNETLERKYLLITDYFNDQFYISTEDSISTDSFDPTAFPRFAPVGVPVGTEYQVPRDLIKLGVPTPMGCVGITAITPLSEDIKRQNLMLHKGWQFRVKHIDVFGRESEHGPISDRYFTVLGSACLASANGLPRCVRLNIPAGGPLIAKIQVEFRTCSGTTTDTDWHLYDIFDKYDSCPDVAWYAREINNPYAQAYIDAHNTDPSLDANTLKNILENRGILRFISATNTFDYTFCANKMGGILPASEVTRIQNPLPLKSSSLFRLDRGIGLANNVRGFEPLHCDTLKKISFTVTAPAEAACSDNIFRTVVFYAAVWNLPRSLPSGVFFGNGPTTGLYSFGLNGDGNLSPGSPPFANKQFDQAFPQYQRGWVGYLAGTPFWAVSETYIHFLDDDSEIIADPVNMPDPLARAYITVEKFTIKNVPAGKYVARIASHWSKPTDDYQKTSTFVTGQVPLANLKPTSGGVVPATGALTNLRKEFDIDCCSADQTISSSLLQIADQTITTNYAYVGSSYIIEDNTDNRPIELAKIVHSNSVATRYITPYSDHNGFVFYYINGGSSTVNLTIIGYFDVHGDPDCAGAETNSLLFQASGLVYTGFSPTIKRYVKTGLGIYPAANRRLITGRVQLCDQPLVGIPGALVVIKNGPYARTDINGDFTIVLHRRWDTWLTDGDTLIYSQSGGACILYACNDCSNCFTNVPIEYKDCDASPDRNTAIDAISARIRGAGQSGPKNGGRYRMGIMTHDWMGRVGFVQSDESHYLNAPNLIDTQMFAFSTFGFAIDASVVFPLSVRRISFCITRNLNWEDDFHWIADKIKFVDGAGNENTANPTQIQIYYESLLQYNKVNNYGTNANWQAIVTQDTTDKSVIGDTVQFIRNGDGVWFDRDTTTLVRYDTAGKYFTVDYSASLAKLKAGVLFKLIRPKEFTTEDLFYELCPIIDVVNGKPKVLTGTLPYTDSYLMARQVPVPEDHIDPNDPTKTIRDVYIRNTAFFFEHTSPSDFWGDHCASGGRVNVRNVHERQYYQTSEIALSKPIVGSSTFNGLSYFDLADVTIFDQQQWGDITLVLAENNTLLVLCAHDNFIVGFNDTTARVGASGVLTAGSQPGKFGTPQRKIGMNNGCQMEDIMTVQKRYGIVIFLDKANSKLIVHSYTSSEDASNKIGFAAWMFEKVAAMQAYAAANPSMLAYFIGGIDPLTKTYYFTNIRIKKDGSGSPVGGYVNQLHETDVNANETVGIHLPSLTLRSFSFTPLMYGSLERFHKANTVFAMVGPNAWSLHNGYQNPSYNNFFGIQCKKVFTVVTNLGNEKEKHFLCFELYCKQHLFIAELVLTESGQISRVKNTYIRKADTFYKAEYLCAINTPPDPNLVLETGVNAIVDGDLLYGRWLETRFISEDADDPKYCELSAVVNYLITSEKSAV